MKFDVGDTIAAVATPPGTGGVGIIRISGPEAGGILSRLVRVELCEFRDRYLEYGLIYDGDECIDEVLYVVMKGPRSFTGEDVGEIHGHGGVVNMARLFRLVVRSGARPAGPGEFSRRAFANGRIDLTQAEAVVNIVNASSEKALRIGQRQRQGKLNLAIRGLIASINYVLAEVEASIDFPEERVPDTEREKRLKTISEAYGECVRLVESYGVGRSLQDGIDVVLRGPANAGKSSLFNRLIDDERSIVAPDPGTTRDYIEAKVEWSGYAVTLVDTAGTRGTNTEVESRGIAMGVRRAEKADVELVIRACDDESPLPKLSRNQILVRSKCDLSVPVADLGIATSARSGSGIETLQREILMKCTGGNSDGSEDIMITNERQRLLLVGAAQSLLSASELLLDSSPSELIAADLCSARQHLHEMIGEEIGDEILDELFSRFCIGK